MAILLLYWPPWSWKSTIGKKLAEYQGMNHIDTDTILESRYWKIWDIIAKYGMNYFRELESLVLLDVVESHSVRNWVISLGWWTLLRRENLWIIQTMRWKIITLIWDTDTLYQNIISDRDNHRPLVMDKVSFWKLMLERQNHYETFDTTVRVHDKDINTIVDEILMLIAIPSPVPRSPWVSVRSLVDHSTL